MLGQMKPVIYITQLRRLSYGRLINWYSGLVQRPPPTAPYSHVIQIGDPVLRVVSDPVPTNLVKSPEIQFLVKRLRSVFKRYNCIGLSAPQIGITLRVFIVEFNAKHAKSFSSEDLKNKEMNIFPQTVKYLRGKLFKVVINPELKVLDYKQIMYSEACESIKGFWADVPRYRAVEIRGLNENGEEILINAKGWLARIFQHELDHLNGKLYTDVMDRKTLTCSCWQIVNERRGKVEIPFHQ